MIFYPDPSGEVTGASPLVEKVLALLEEAGVAEATNDMIVRLIEQWEFAQMRKIPDEPDYSDEPGIKPEMPEMEDK